MEARPAKNFRLGRTSALSTTATALHKSKAKNEKPADTARAFVQLCHQKVLERAKGFEPSTPTLARSCSTTELHPHPRDWRRSLTGNAQSYAKCGPRMQQPAHDLR